MEVVSTQQTTQQASFSDYIDPPSQDERDEPTKHTLAKWTGLEISKTRWKEKSCATIVDVSPKRTITRHNIKSSIPEYSKPFWSQNHIKPHKIHVQILVDLKGTHHVKLLYGQIAEVTQSLHTNTFSCACNWYDSNICNWRMVAYLQWKDTHFSNW